MTSIAAEKLPGRALSWALLSGLLATLAGCGSDSGGTAGPTEPRQQGMPQASSSASAGAPIALVTNQGSGTVSVIDLAARSVGDVVDVGTQPNGVAVTADGATALVANQGDNSVSVIDVATRTEVATIDVGAAPNGVAITSDGALALVANEGDGTVSVVDVDSRTEEATIDIGAAPEGVAITPDDRLAVVANGPAFVSVIDIAARTEETTIGTDSGPYRVAITPDGTLALVTNSDFLGENLSVIDIAARTEIERIDLGEVPNDVAITPDGSQAVIANALFASLQVLDIPAREVEDPFQGIVLDPLGGPDGVAVTTDGDEALVAVPTDNTVRVFDIAGRSQTDNIAVGEDPVNVAVVPEVVRVHLDIRPGSHRNSLNLQSHGLLPVAVLTTPHFEADRIDPATVTLGDEEGDDTPVAKRGNGGPHATLEDVDDDGDRDLVVKFETAELARNGDADQETGELVLTGKTADGRSIRGVDAVTIVGGPH